MALPQVALLEAARLRERAEAELDLLLADLATWVDVDTPGGDLEALDGLARVLALEAERYGLEPELVETPGGLALHATLRGSGTARVALLGHHDTVFPLGTAAARPFRRDGERCFGPGVADMKGGVAVALHTARLLAEGPRPFGLVEVVSVPDEESRNGGPPSGGRLLDMDAVLCLECGRPNGEVVSRRKGARWFRIRASGRAAHAGEAPAEGRNAALALAREALRIGALHGAREELTLQITGLEAGEGLNTVPSSGSLTADLRAWTEEDLAWALGQALEYGNHEGVELSYEDLGGPPPMERTEAVGRLAEAAIELGAGFGHVFGETAAGGVSDGSWAASQGLPTLDGLGPVGGEDHTPWEYIETASIATRCGVVAGLVAAVDAGLLD
ncbi:MAG TPA: M20/M25/M40 family metallo-hydrolase [Gaiellaceae bacterium]|nr:M20/M25/M40 family metallo-hydrolase [Gaiellaceae bacterium]